MVALHPHGRRLDASHLARAHLHQFGLPAARLAPAQVHPQQHLGPVLGLGAAGAGLDVDEGVGRIHPAGEHALELERLGTLLESGDVGDDRLRGVLVALGCGEIEQVGGLVERLADALQLADDLLQAGTLAPQLLGARSVVPDLGKLEFAGDFFEAFLFAGVVKDTP
jgi:hypothetical protein